MAPEPSDFDSKVRRPGEAFLQRCPNPTGKDFRKRNYWKKILPQLRSAYRNICAYSACWIPAQGTVDHFRPKSTMPSLAYEWSNYRLSMDKINSYKAESDDIADPFSIQENWFALDFTSFYVTVGEDLCAEEHDLVEYTIQVLRLNADDSLVDWRFSVVQSYSWGHTTFDYLLTYFPFIARELRRQQLEETIKGMFPSPPK